MFRSDFVTGSEGLKKPGEKVGVGGLMNLLALLDAMPGRDEPWDLGSNNKAIEAFRCI